MTAEEYALYRAEETRRELNTLNAKVELGTDIGYELSEILTQAINDVEALLDRE